MSQSRKLTTQQNDDTPINDALQNPNVETQSNFIESLNLFDPVKCMETLKHLLLNAPDIDQTKINFFKDELLTGRYEIHPLQIAHQILEHVQLIVEPEMA